MSRFEFAGLSDTFKQFFHDVGAYSIAGIVPASLSLVALVIFTRVFSPAAFGRYAIAMTVVSVGSTLLYGWLDQSTLRLAPEMDERELIGTTLVTHLGITTVVLLTAGAVYELLQDSFGLYEPFYFATVALVVTQGIFQPLLLVYQATLRSQLVTLFKTIRAVAQLGFALFLALFLLDSIVGWLWGSVLAILVTVGVMMTISDTLRTIPRIRRDVLLRIAGYGLPMLGWILGDPLLNQADRLLIEFIRGSKAVGIYASNYSLVDMGLRLALVPILSAAQPIVFNAWSGENEAEVERLLRRFTRYFLILSVPPLVLVGVLSKPLSTLLLGEQYHSGFVVIPLVAGGVALWSFSNLGQVGLQVKEQTGIMSRGLILAVVFNVAVDVPLIYAFGYIGAAVGTLCSYAVYAVFVWLVSRDRVRWVLPTRTVLNVALAGFVMTLPVALLYITSEYTMIRAILLAAVSPLLYAAMLLWTQEVSGEELQKVRGMF